MRQEETRSNYEEVEADINGGVNVQCYLCERIRTEARPYTTAEE